MKIHHRLRCIAKASRPGFTRWELCAVLAAVFLLMALGLPMLAGTRQASDTAQCQNNLRRMGMAAQMKAMELGNEFHWRVIVQEGGLLSTQARNANAWFDFFFLTNELREAKILACPADRGTRPANSFSELSSPAFRNNAVSYTINLHASAWEPGVPIYFDRNLNLFGPAGCSEAFVNNTLRFRTSSAYGPTWTSAVHGFQGNMVQGDGSAYQTSDDRFRDAMRGRNMEQIVHVLPGNTSTP